MSSLTAASDIWPGGNLTFRYFAADQNAYRLATDKREAARQWWLRSGHIPDLVDEIRRKGLESTPIYVEIMNEIYSHNIDDNLHSVEFEKAAVVELQRLAQEYNVILRALAFTGAVGNPQMPDEAGGPEIWSHLLELARIVEQHAGGFAYHAYYGMNAEHPEYLCELAPWLQNRWMAYDEYLTAHGVYIPWSLGECGGVQCWLELRDSALHVAEIMSDAHKPQTVKDLVPMFHGGMRPIPLSRTAFHPLRYMPGADVRPSGMEDYTIHFNPMGGWRAHISKERYADELMVIDGDWFTWNRANNWRLNVGDIFQSGTRDPAWQWFTLEGDDLAHLRDRIVEGYD
jgi:hypothetical protein